MRKNCKHVPPALKHGIYSGIGLLPTESRAKFRKFRRQRFAELSITGPSEEDIGDDIVRFEWRGQNLFTYALAQRARDWDSSIYSKWVSSQWDFPAPSLLVPGQEPPSPEELEAARKRAKKEIRTRLGSAIELVQIGKVVTYEFLEKELAIREKLNAMINQLYKKLAYVRAIKSMSPPTLPAPAPPLLENTSQS